MRPLDLALVARFAADFARVLGRTPGADERIALAVSGGPDSMAMLGLAHAAFPGQVVAATVDHRLRPESADEAAMVSRACAALGVPYATLPVEVPKGASGNLHAWARQERYLLLKRWAVDAGAPILCTAHHAEDQAETFLMRAARASGLSGLAAVRGRVETGQCASGGARPSPSGEGMGEGSRRANACPASTPPQPLPVQGRGSGHSAGLVLLRPLLRWRRAELRIIAETGALPFTDDPSNADPRFDRSVFRRWLEQAPWIDPLQIGRSAEYLGDIDTDLREVSRWLWTERTLPSESEESRIDVGDLPRGVRRYVARIAIENVQRTNGMDEAERPPGSIEPLLDALESGRSATHAGVMASAKGTIWHFREAPPRRAG